MPNGHDEFEQALSRLYHAQDVPAGFETGWRAAVRREESLQMTQKPHTKRTLWRVFAPACAALVLVAGSLWAGTAQPGLNGDTAPASRSAAKTAAVAPSARSSSQQSANGALYSAASETDGAITEDAMMDTGGSATEAGLAPQAQSGRKLVRTAGLTLRSTDFDADSQRVEALLESLNGYVESLYQYSDSQSDTPRRLHMSLRVPSGQLDAFLSGVSGIGRVTDRSESTTDMTVEYTDNAARLQTLRDKLARLNELIKQAEDVESLIQIETAISDTQYQIDRYETSQRDIDRQVDMSAVSVTLIEETAAQSASATDVSLGERIRAALAASVEWLGRFLRDMLVFVAMALPWALPAAAAAAVLWLVVRRRRAKRNNTSSGEE